MIELTGREVIPMRLRDLVSKGRKSKLFCVFGPAGFGRSTLLAFYAQPLRSDPANHIVYVDCARVAKRPGALWRQLSAGLDDGPLQDLLAAEQTMDEDPDPQAVDDLLESLFATVEKRGVDYYCLIDDAHLLPAGLELQLVQMLADRAPQRVHVAVSGQRNPGIALSRLRLSRNVTEVIPRDLRLTEQESVEAVRSVAPSLSLPHARRVAQLAGGWAAGLTILSLQAEAVGDIDQVLADLDNGTGWIADFLHEEILSGLSPVARSFAQRMSLLGPINARLVSAVAPGVGYEALVSELVDANVLVEVAAPERLDGMWHICHPLLAPCLRADARTALDAGEANALIAAAVDWLDSAGCYKEAFKLASVSGNGERAFGVMTNHLFTVLANAEGGKLSQLLEEVPMAGSRDEYLYSLLSAYAYAIRGLPKMVERWLARAAAAEGTAVVRDVRVERSASAIMQTAELSVLAADGRYEVAISKAEELAEQLGGPQLFLRATALHKMGEALERVGRYQEARESINRAHIDASLSGRRVIELLCDYELAWLLFIDGKLDAASSVALKALATCTEEEKQGSWAVGLLHVALARLFLQWGDAEKVAEHVGKAEELLTIDSNDDAYIECWVTKARCLAQRGDFEGAHDLLLKCYEVAESESMPRGIDLLVAVSFAGTLIGMGQGDRAGRVLEKARSMMHGDDHFYQVHVRILAARLAVNGGDYGQAEEVLREALSIAEGKGVGLLVPDCKIRLAAVLNLQGMRKEAEELMAQALLACAEEERLYPFRNPLPQQNSLVYAIAHARNNNLVRESGSALTAEFARRVLETYGASDALKGAGEQPEGGRAAALASLSEREQQIYELLKAGKTRKEIAETLDIRVNTVRTHVRNLYKKLGIHDRSML